MPVLVTGRDCVEAWEQVVRRLNHVPGRREANTMVHIQEPTNTDERCLARFNPRAVKLQGDNAHDVANTLFPAKTLRNLKPSEDLYSRYAKAYRRGAIRKFAWGTYFGRLTTFGAKRVNQLDRAIESARHWQNNHRSVLTFHLSSAETDGIRVRGGPCLQYIQLNCPTKHTVDAVAVYRAHDYFNKALGNFIGLSRILQFFALQTGRTAGSLTVLSIDAFLEASHGDVVRLLMRQD